MIVGVVTADLEATVPLEVLDASGRQHRIEAIVDTGFTGFLTLPSALIGSLGLVWLGREEGVLADGTVRLFDVYEGTVTWDSQWRTVEVEAADTDPLLGVSLLRGHDLRIQVVDGGTVIIMALP